MQLQSPADWEAFRDLAAVIVPSNRASAGLSSSAERSIFCNENVRGPVASRANNERRRATAIDRSHFWLASLETLSRARVQNQMFRRSRCLTHQWPSACIGIIRLI